jgi:RNA polymerase sigma-70 factor (ECF subfamily)
VHDKDLIEKIRNNDTQAFKELIDKYKSQSFRIAIGFVHNKAIAEDIVQEVFIKFWEIRKDFELTAKFSTWLYRVTANKAINSIRKNKFTSVFSSFSGKNDQNDDFEDFEKKIEDENKIDENFKEEHIKKALKTAIDSLPKKQKIAFVLNKYQDFSYKEIAEIMELTLSSVESLLHRAKKNLQKKLFDVYKNLN